jgi:hypothetical protein
MMSAKRRFGGQPHRGTSRIKRPKLLLVPGVAIALLIACSMGASVAGASLPIEGVWSFNGGRVDIVAGAGGKLEGIVTSPTRFAQCTHEDGERMWTDMTPEEPGGSYYWGLHQWFYENAACTRNTMLGATAWRVLEAEGGNHYLLVCFSFPEVAEQPIISVNGTPEHASYGCVGSAIDTAHVASVPVDEGSTPGAEAESFRKVVSLPRNKACFGRRVFSIHLKNPKYDPIKEVVVTLGKRRIRVRRHEDVFTATIDLKDLPRGTFTVKIEVTTVLGHHLVGRRTYQTCPTRRKPGKAKSKSGKPSVGRQHS